MHERYQISLSAASIQLEGINNIHIKGLRLVPENADTLLSVDDAMIDLSLLSLLKAQIGFDNIELSRASMTIYNTPQRNNLKSLRLLLKNNRSTVSHSGISYHDKALRYQASLFRILRTAFDLKQMQFSYEDTTGTETIYVPSFHYDLHSLSGSIINLEKADTLSIEGLVVKKQEVYQCTVTHSNKDSIYLPFLNRAKGLKCRFEKIDARLTLNDNNSDYEIQTEVSLSDFHLNHWRLSKTDVILPEALFKGVLKITDNAIELDSGSSFKLHQVVCHPYSRWQRRPDTSFALQLRMPEVAADSFFAALPSGTFNTVRGISCSGSLAFDLSFCIQTNNPDSLQFHSALRQKNLQIRHYGAENYARINGSFTYEAYDKDRLVRLIQVGPENPSFTPLSEISPYLPQSVLQAEDPSFMQHRGFLADAFRESIVKNYKERRFARGGSTISMQLVKNVFLNRDKTISRKAEEALIVYLIENLGIVPKERMLEVYLNVIEWGPNVYGIGEAAKFYFGKRPTELTLQESLFLASIIPRPKSFQYQFDKEGQLRQSLGSYFRILTERMVWRGVLNPSDTIGLQPKVTLKGAALHTIIPSDSLPDTEDTTEE